MAGTDLLDRLFDTGGPSQAASVVKPAETTAPTKDAGKGASGSTPAADRKPGATSAAPEAEPKTTTTDPKPGKAEATVTAKDAADEARGSGGDPDTSAMTDAERGKHEAMLAERTKRHEAEKRAQESEQRARDYEQRLAAIEQRIAAQQGGQKPDTKTPDIETPVDFWGNPLKHSAEQTRQIVREEARLALWNNTRSAALKAHPDFDQVAKQFESEMSTNPYLAGWWYGQENPAEALYDYMTRIKPALANGGAAPTPANGSGATTAGTDANQQHDAVDEEAIRARVRAEVEQEMAEKRAANQARGTPQSQAGAIGSGASPGRTVASGEQLLERMFSVRR